MDNVIRAVVVGAIVMMSAPNCESYAVAITEKDGGKSTRPLAEV